jgi:serine/threonine protein kinase
VAHGRRLLFQRLTDFGTGRLPANVALKQGRYRVIQVIGKGGMGAVYLAYDTQQSDKLVAIKEMSQAHLKDEEELRLAQQRFQQEADLLQQLQHPHLPRVYDSFADRNRSYLVMDYIQGKTLAQVLKQAHGSALSVKQVVDYGLHGGVFYPSSNRFHYTGPPPSGPDDPPGAVFAYSGGGSTV